MKKYTRICTIITGLLLLPTTTFAQIRITEIMYDVPGTDTGREWIEIYNDSDSDVASKDVTVFENNTQHKLDVSGGATIPAHNYAIVADNKDKFLVDNPSYSGLLFDSAFSLSNTGEPLAVYVNGTLDDSVTYSNTTGAGGDGNTLQKDGDTFIAAAPTLGEGYNKETTQEMSSAETETSTSTVINSTSTSSSTALTSSTQTNTSTTSNQSTISTHSSSYVATSLPDLKLKADAGRERMVTINTPVSFEGRIQANGKEVTEGKYIWSFGDGTSEKGREVEHTFLFPGEYNVVLNTEYEKTKAVSRIKVHVMIPEVLISVNQQEGFTEISNKSSKEVNIGEWRLESKKGFYSFAEDTIISSNTKLKIPIVIGKVGETVRLVYPNDMEETQYIAAGPLN